MRKDVFGRGRLVHDNDFALGVLGGGLRYTLPYTRLCLPRKQKQGVRNAQKHRSKT